MSNLDPADEIQLLKNMMEACPDHTREHWEPPGVAEILMLENEYKFYRCEYVIIEDGKRLIARLIWKDELGTEAPQQWGADILFVWDPEQGKVEEFRPDPQNPARFKLHSVSPPTRH
jgi:hypothetical protein